MSANSLAGALRRVADALDAGKVCFDPQDAVDIMALAHEIATQDGCATSYPWFVVKQLRTIYVHPDTCDAEVRWYNDSLDEEVCEKPEHIDDESDDDSDELPDGWRRIGVLERPEVVAVGLSSKSCHEYIAANRHNLTEPRVYAMSAHAMPEIRLLRRALLALTQGSE